jgi:hypothetical protein
MGELSRKRHLTNDQCKRTAAKIKAEMPQFEQARQEYVACSPQQSYSGSFVPIWPTDPDACHAKIRYLFHDAEAEIIIKHLS